MYIMYMKCIFITSCTTVSKCVSNVLNATEVYLQYSSNQVRLKYTLIKLKRVYDKELENKCIKKNKCYTKWPLKVFAIQ